MILSATLSLLILISSGQSPPATVSPISFKNETPIPVLVQVKSIFNGQLLRDRPYLIKSGETSPPIQIPGTKSVSISDSKSLRPLVQLPLPQTNEELLIAIVGTEKSMKLELRKPTN